MQGKPFFPAGLTAEGRPLVFRLRHFYRRSAVAASKGSPDNDRADFLGMFPIQPLAVGRTEFDPPVRWLRHSHQFAAFQAAEGAQGFFFPWQTDMIVRSVPMSVAAAVGTAVFLRDAVSCKLLAAYGTYSLPLHRYPPLSPTAVYRIVPIQARKKDSIYLCCLKNTSFITGYTYPRMLSVIIRAWEIEECPLLLRHPPYIISYSYGLIRYSCILNRSN